MIDIHSALICIDKFVTENNNFESIYYTHRFTQQKVLVPRFIAEVKWSCNVEHMIDKWHEAQRRTDCYGWFTAFFCELDTCNREALIEWLLANRNSRYDD